MARSNLVNQIDQYGLNDAKSDCQCAYREAVGIFMGVIREYPNKQINQLLGNDCNFGSTMVQVKLLDSKNVMTHFGVFIARRGKFLSKVHSLVEGTHAHGTFIPFGPAKWIRFVRLHSVVVVNPKAKCRQWYSMDVFDFLEQSIYNYSKFDIAFPLVVTFGDPGYYLVNPPPDDDTLIPGQTVPYVKTNLTEEIFHGLTGLY
ncbi:MAG: hypothetical protein HPZ91_00005 [Lentisphaeria bacterium]|nr:hypothetical protein [Lentisphaeria bacterium]